MRTLLRLFLLPFLAGLAIWASFAPLHIWVGAVIGVALIVFLNRAASLLQALVIGWVSGMGYFLPLLSWSALAAGTHLAWFALAAVQALYVSVVVWLWKFTSLIPAISRNLWLRAAAFALVWIAGEQLRASWPLGGMPWGMLGFGQVNSPLIHLAPWGSTQIIAFVLVGAAVLLEEALNIQRRHKKKQRLLYAIIATSCLVTPILIPLAHTGESNIKIAYAQGKVPRSDAAIDDSIRPLVVTRNLAEEVQGLQGQEFDVLVLPESTSDYDIRTYAPARDVIEAIEETIEGRPILLGTQEYLDNSRLNDYVLVYEGKVQQRYSKQHPVPFGEYLPARDILVSLIDEAGRISVDMEAGEKPAVIDVPVARQAGGTLRFGVPICFEVGDSSIVSQAVRLGASILVVPTNNASFGQSAEAEQQFDMTRFRAVETSRSAIQISTVGISGMILPDGTVLHRSQLWGHESYSATLPVHNQMTFACAYQEHIQILTYISGIVIAITALLSYINSMRKGRENT